MSEKWTKEEIDRLNQGARQYAEVNGLSNPDDDLDELPAPPRKDIPEADRLLLELAARALGARFEEVDGEGYGNLHFEDGSVVYGWNSLQFSGDAFDLAASLPMMLRTDLHAQQSVAEWDDGEPCVEHWSFSLPPDAAARRAATRAAAEIGKTMP